MSKLKREVSLLSKSSVGTYRWSAPETLRGKSSVWTEKADIYSLGMVFYEIASREIPFRGEHELDIVEDIKSGKRPTIPSECPKVFI